MLNLFGVSVILLWIKLFSGKSGLNCLVSVNQLVCRIKTPLLKPNYMFTEQLFKIYRNYRNSLLLDKVAYNSCVDLQNLI